MEEVNVSHSPSQCTKMMHRRNVRRAIQSIILCLTLVYVSALVVWGSGNSSLTSTSTTNQNETSSRSAEGILRSFTLSNSTSHHNRQLKNHLLNVDEAVAAHDLTVSEKRAHQTSLEDIFLSVKTTRIFHPSRLEVILNTWFRLAKNQVSSSSPTATLLFYFSLCVWALPARLSLRQRTLSQCQCAIS